MNLGVIDQSAGADATGLYPDALAVADFVHGIYMVGGVDVSLASMIDSPGLVSASGLYIQWDTNPGSVLPLGDFLAALLTANYTMVIEFELIGLIGGSEQIYALTLADSGTPQLRVSDDKFSTLIYDDVAGRTAGFVDVIADPSPRTVKIAFTTTTAGLSVSVDGEAVDTDNTAGSPMTPTQAVIGSDTFDGWANMIGYIHAIFLYPPKADGELPALSTQ